MTNGMKLKSWSYQIKFPSNNQLSFFCFCKSDINIYFKSKKFEKKTFELKKKSIIKI